MTKANSKSKIAIKLPTVKKYKLSALNRLEIRKHLINQFLQEDPGTGKGSLRSAYVYEVEDISVGGDIFLKRPASLNKGMDFTVHVKGYKFRSKGLVDMPSHANIIDDLKLKKKSDPAKYKDVANLINRIFNCENITAVDCSHLVFDKADKVDLSVPQVLLSIKWLFIEQDITYWNWSGRNMLKMKLKEEGLC